MMFSQHSLQFAIFCSQIKGYNEQLLHKNVKMQKLCDMHVNTIILKTPKSSPNDTTLKTYRKSNIRRVQKNAHNTWSIIGQEQHTAQKNLNIQTKKT